MTFNLRVFLVFFTLNILGKVSGVILIVRGEPKPDTFAAVDTQLLDGKQCS